MTHVNERWEDPELVAEFARREPDHRLRTFLDSPDAARPGRALDLGCGAGRNAILLAERGWDVFAVDLSHSMVDETRRRLAPVIGASEANRRVVRGAMDDLSSFQSESFDILVALGVYQQATTVAEWDRAIDESVRVLRPGGRLLVAHFAPGTDLTGEDGAAIAGEDHLFRIRPGHPSVLFDAEELDERIASRGLVPVIPTETVERPHEPAGRRVTVNALYRKIRSE